MAHQNRRDFLIAGLKNGETEGWVITLAGSDFLCSADGKKMPPLAEAYARMTGNGAFRRLYIFCAPCAEALGYRLREERAAELKKLCAESASAPCEPPIVRFRRPMRIIR